MHTPPDGANPFLYLLLVYLHVLMGLMAMGMNATYGIWIARATKDTALLPFVLKGVQFLDDRVANPLYIATGVTGVIMVAMGKAIKPFLWVAIALYVLVMLASFLVYTPLLREQIRTLEKNGAENAAYQRLAARSNLVGAGLGIAALVIVLLKIYKPPLW